MIKKIQRSIQVKLVLPIVLGALVVVSFSTSSMFYINQTGTIRLAGFTGGALALLAVIVVVLLRRTVIKPVQVLIATYERVSIGDLAARVPVQSNDEMGELSTGLNTLLDRLVNLLETTQAERDSAQAAIQKLLEEVSDVATGDLTVEAEVTTDMTGAIADSFNSMIHQLRTIITHVQETALQVS